MCTIKKAFGILFLALILNFSVNTTIKAQSPADDPGIGGPGSPGSGPSGDGAPVVPIDGGMSLLLLASGVGYAAKKFKVFNLYITN